MSTDARRQEAAARRCLRPCAVGRENMRERGVRGKRRGASAKRERGHDVLRPHAHLSVRPYARQVRRLRPQSAKYTSWAMGGQR